MPRLSLKTGAWKHKTVRLRSTFLALIVVFLAFVGHAESADYIITTDVLDGGCGAGSSANYSQPRSSIGQPFAGGAASSGNYVDNAGILDTIAPITTASPPGETWAIGQSVILNCTDVAGSGCDKIYYTTDGTTPTILSTVYAGPITIYGNTTLKFFAVDLAGNNESVKAEVYEYIICAAILKTTASPAGGMYTSAQNVTLTSNFTGSGCDYDKIYYTADGTTPTTSSSVYSGSISITSTTTLKFFATDVVGNNEAVKTESYTIDNVAPVLTLSTLSNGAITNNNTLNTSGTVTDNTGVQDLTINGNAVTVDIDGSFSYALSLNEGANVITTVATDLAGNETTDTRTITLDTAAPALVIDTPADNSKTAGSIATITGTIDETSIVAITLNGGTPQYASVTGNTFTLDIVLAFGVNTIEITATDTAGNTSTQKRTVTYDNTKPSLEITEPNQDIRTNQGSIIIKGAISDALTAVSVSVTVDGNTYNPAISNGQFEQAVTFIAEKTYTVTVTATDEAGNTTTVQRNIIYDITQPIINFTVTTPTNMTGQTIPGTMEEGATVTATSATATVGIVTYPAATTWSVNVTGMAEGSNTITAIDAAGNETTVAKQIVVDTIAPDTTITSQPPALTNSASASFSSPRFLINDSIRDLITLQTAA